MRFIEELYLVMTGVTRWVPRETLGRKGEREETKKRQRDVEDRMHGVDPYSLLSEL